MSEVRPLRMADRFYLARKDHFGADVYDVMPWENATEYVTDGERIGVRFQDDTVLWAPTDEEIALREQFREDFSGVDIDALLQGLQAYAGYHSRLKDIWQRDLGVLQELRSESRLEGPAPG